LRIVTFINIKLFLPFIPLDERMTEKEWMMFTSLWWFYCQKNWNY